MNWNNYTTYTLQLKGLDEGTFHFPDRSLRQGRVAGGNSRPGATGVSFNGTGANFTIQSDTYLTATIPQGATTGFVTVTTSGGTLQSNVAFRVKP
jgi:hypothetical protein